MPGTVFPAEHIGRLAPVVSRNRRPLVTGEAQRGIHPGTPRDLSQNDPRRRGLEVLLFGDPHRPARIHQGCDVIAVFAPVEHPPEQRFKRHHGQLRKTEFAGDEFAGRALREQQGTQRFAGDVSRG
jgi:hypothetical protein